MRSQEYKMRNRESKNLFLTKAFPRHPGIQNRTCLGLGELGFKSIYPNYIKESRKTRAHKYEGKTIQHLIYLNKGTYFGENDLLSFHQ